MKKICMILAAVILGAAAHDAFAQLKIGGTTEGSKRLSVLSMEWNWLYLVKNHYFLVTKTTNQFDDWIWLDLGDTQEVAAETIGSLIELLETGEKETQIESLGKTYTLMYSSELGVKFFRVHSSERAGLGNITMQALKKAATYLQKE